MRKTEGWASARPFLYRSMRRTVLILLFISIALVSLSAGGEKESVFIGVSVYRFDDAFIGEIRDHLERLSAGDIPIVIRNPENSQNKQNEQISGFIEEGASAIIVNPVDRTASGVIIEKCRKAGIPLVFFNREPLADDMARWDEVYYVGARAEAAGRFAARIFIDYWEDHPEADRNGDGKLQFVIIKGEPGHQDTELRSEYLMKTLAEAGISLDRLDEESGMWERGKAESLMTQFLITYGDSIEAVFSNNDEMALGAIDALERAGYFTAGRYMPVIGCDAIPEAYAALSDGTLLGTVLNDAENQAKAIYNIAKELAEGRTPSESAIGFPITDERYVWIPYTMVLQSGDSEYNH